MTRSKYLFTLVVMLLVFRTTAQQKATLKIGDSLPDFIISKILNTANGSLSTRQNTASFNDKLLIVDFWATSCSGCVAALPKMAALQKQFGGKVKILPVTYEPASLVSDFWKKNKHTKNLTLATAVEDKAFKAYFPHEAIPHEVWVYKGKVIGITDPDYVDTYNIGQVLSGKVPGWPVKNDYYVYDAANFPLFTPDEKQVDVNAVYTYAGISDYKEKDGASAAGVFGNVGIVRDSVRKTIRTWFVNQAIFTSYIINWIAVVGIKNLIKPSSSLDPNQIIWKVNDPEKYMYQSSLTPDFKTGYRGDWMRKNAICFESVKRDTGQTNKDISKGIIADLDRLLGLKVGWEKRKEMVLVLVSSGKKAAVSPKPDQTKRSAVNSAAELVYELNRVAQNPYVFNEIKGEIKLDLNAPSWTDIPAVRKALLPYGLELKEEERWVDKFVFSERDGTLLVDADLIAAAKVRKEEQKDLGLPALELNNSLLETNKAKPGVVVLPSGLQYKIIKQGKGPMPGPKGFVRVHYTGMLANGKIFESSFESGKPVMLGVNEVIKGWTEALQLMPAGSKWELYIPARLAYGSDGNPDIPENSTLIFELELLEIVK